MCLEESPWGHPVPSRDVLTALPSRSGQRQAGWVAAEAVRTRAGDQSKPPAISSQAKSSLGSSALPFYSQRDRASQGQEEAGSPPYMATE